MPTPGRRRKEPTIDELKLKVVSLEAQLKTVQNGLEDLLKYLGDVLKYLRPKKNPKSAKKRQPVTS